MLYIKKGRSVIKGRNNQVEVTHKTEETLRTKRKYNK